MAKKDAALPLRVREALTTLQYKSELLVAFVQLGVIALLFILNYFSPIGYSPDAPVHSAQLGLLLFTILVLVRLWFAYTNQLNPILLGFLVIAEMALLLFIIWTYYLQFETTPTINLKNSHMNYVFILIALRALRFEPIWVILSGLTAAIGWGLIVWHALANTSMDVITWDYVTFASTRSVYPGDYFDKMLAILLVTAIIALALQRARNILAQSVKQTYAAKDLSRFFDNDIAEKITSSELDLKAGYGEIREAAVVFTDMRGFTKASAILTPTELIGLLGEYQRLLVPIIQKHGGTIDKFMGDGIMASFGAVTPSNTYAADALTAVDEIMKKVDEWREKHQMNGEIVVDVGAGLATGQVVFGIIGNENRLEYTVIGEAANLAAKLEKQNKVEHSRALTTYQTLKCAIGQGYKHGEQKEQRKNITVGGTAEPTDLVIIA